MDLGHDPGEERNFEIYWVYPFNRESPYHFTRTRHGKYTSTSGPVDSRGLPTRGSAQAMVGLLADRTKDKLISVPLTYCIIYVNMMARRYGPLRRCSLPYYDDQAIHKNLNEICNNCEVSQKNSGERSSKGQRLAGHGGTYGGGKWKAEKRRARNKDRQTAGWLVGFEGVHLISGSALGVRDETMASDAVLHPDQPP